MWIVLGEKHQLWRCFLATSFCTVAWNYQDGEFFPSNLLFFCPQFVVVCCRGFTPSLKSLSKNQVDDVHNFIRDWLWSTGHLHKASITTHAVFSCLWLCQSWMFGFRFSVLDVSLQAELLFVVPLPPSKCFSHLSWPDKHLKEEKPHSPHFSGLGLSNTEEIMSIGIATQKELNHLENIRREVLGEAKNHNQVSLAYKLCPKSQAFCSSCPLL